jgi:hypothetical protein
MMAAVDYGYKHLHVRDDVHDRVKRYCKRNDVRMCRYVERALRLQVAADERREMEKLREARVRDQREAELCRQEVFAAEPAPDAQAEPWASAPFWKTGAKG